MRFIVHALPVALALLGCRKESGHAHDEEEHAREASHRDEHADGGEGPEAEVRIAREMLRDLRITTASVESRSGGDGVTVLGELRVNEDAYAEVGAPVPARIVRVHVKVADEVVEEQPLVELQSPELGRARAELLKAQARTELARRTAERKRGLASERIVAEGELQSVEADLRTAEAELRAARAALAAFGAAAEAPGADASRLVLRAPLSGRVIERTASVGQMADPAKPLLRVGDLSKLWLVVHAFERDAVRIRPGSKSRVTLPAFPGRTFEASVAAVGQEVDASSRTMPVRLEIANRDDVLRPGMSASAWVSLGDDASVVLTVPSAAVQRLHDGWFVFVPKGEGRFELRAVGRGRDLGGEVEIVSGLAAGESVVVEGAFLLKAEYDKSRGEGVEHEH